MVKEILTPKRVKQLFEADVRQEQLTQIYKLLNGYARAHAASLKQVGIDPDDFVQEVVFNIFRRKGLDNYDPAKTSSWEGLIFRIAKNHLIDLVRKTQAVSRSDVHGKPIKPISLQTPVGDDGATELGNLIGDDKEGEDHDEVDPTDYLMVEPDGRLQVTNFKVTPAQKEAAVVALQKRMKDLGIKSLSDFMRKKATLPSSDRHLIDSLVSKTHESNMNALTQLKKSLDEAEATDAPNSEPVGILVKNKNGGTQHVQYFNGPLAKAMAKAKELYGDDFTFEEAKDFEPKKVTECLQEGEDVESAQQFPVKVARKNNGQFDVVVMPGTDVKNAIANAQKQWGADYDVSSADDYKTIV